MTSSRSETDETIETDCCPICLETFYQPVAPPCGHPLCRSCFVDLRSQGQGAMKCPTCRAPAKTARAMPVTASLIKAADPERYEAARQEVRELRLRREEQRFAARSRNHPMLVGMGTSRTA